MATLTVQTINRDGLVATYGAATVADEFANDGQLTFLNIKNGLTDANFSFTIPGTVDGEPCDPKTLLVSASTEAFIGPFPAGIYNNANGLVSYTLDDASNVTIAVLRLAL